MVFPHNKFPSCENSSLYISASEEKPTLNCFKKDMDTKPVLGTKRPCRDNTYTSITDKRKRVESSFFMKEEISEADFQMKIIKQSLAMKKDWVYRQVLQNLGVESLAGNSVMKCTQQGIYKNGELYKKSSLELSNNELQRNLFGKPHRVYKSRDNKILDEEGNCYIDEEDFKSFYRPQGSAIDKYHSGQTTYETMVTDYSDLSFTPQRNLNFTFHGSNGGVAIDHDALPKVIGIHSVPRRGRSHGKHQTQHIEARLDGATYKAATTKTSDDRTCADNHVKEESKWWPPSPESISDDHLSSNEGEGLLKVMTFDDMKAYGLSKQEKLERVNQESSQDDDVIVTHVKQGVENRISSISGNIDLREMPALQLDVHGKPTNYKEILLHYITQQLKNNPQNPSLQKITDEAVAGRRRKAMNMDELCKKLLNTREKLEKEQRKWKRKLLSSLEVVLIKKIRKLEQTGEEVPTGIDLHGSVMLQNVQCSGNCSQSDIVAVMEDLTAESGDVQTTQSQKITERSSRGVSRIRGYDSS